MSQVDDLKKALDEAIPGDSSFPEFEGMAIVQLEVVP